MNKKVLTSRKNRYKIIDIGGKGDGYKKHK